MTNATSQKKAQANNGENLLFTRAHQTGTHYLKLGASMGAQKVEPHLQGSLHKLIS